MTTATLAGEIERKTNTRQRAILLVALCTVCGAAAQLLIKSGANALPPTQGVLPMLLAMAANLPLVAGYSLYGISTVLLVLALRYGELSLLYPIIALTYVWVSVLSALVFHEIFSVPKAIGIALIVAGVAVLGRGKSAQ